MKRTDPTPTLVLIHDLFGSSSEFDFIAPILGAREVRIDCLTVDGYSHGAGRRAQSWHDWLAAAGTALDRGYDAEAPIALAGIGTGAALAAALALQPRRRRLAGVVLLASSFGSCAQLSLQQRVAAALRLDRHVDVARGEPFGVKNPKTRKAVARQLAEDGISSIGPALVPLRALRESDRLHAHVRTSLASLDAPLLALHARDDEAAPLAAIERVVAELGRHGRPARLIVLEHSYHRITVDNDRQRVAHELADFIGAPKRRAQEPARAPQPARVPVPADWTAAAN